MEPKLYEESYVSIKDRLATPTGNCMLDKQFVIERASKVCYLVIKKCKVHYVQRMVHIPILLSIYSQFIHDNLINVLPICSNKCAFDDNFLKIFLETESK